MVREYQATCAAFGLTVSNTKTKHMVVGNLVEEEDREPIAVAGGEICSVDEFPYLGSLIAASGRMDGDVDRRIAQASQAFGALRKAVFMDKDLTLKTKRKIYQACVLPVLLYGAECWDSPQQTYQENQHIPSQVYQDYPRDFRPAAVVQAHHHERDKEAMG